MVQCVRDTNDDGCCDHKNLVYESRSIGSSIFDVIISSWSTQKHFLLSRKAMAMAFDRAHLHNDDLLTTTGRPTVP
jgi:hypothetical protein